MITIKTVYKYAMLRALTGSGGTAIKTASGVIASFNSNTEAPIIKGVFDIDYDSNGLSSMAITRCGKNFWSLGDVSGTRNTTKNIFIPSGDYVFSAVVTSSDTDGSTSAVLFTYSDGTSLTRRINRNTRDSVAITLSKDVVSIRFYAGYNQEQSANDTFEYADIQIELGTQPTSYEAYSGDTYPVSFGTTIYGGYFESETGVLTSTKASDGTDLATPVKAELTPIPITTLNGDNNIFCDTGDSDIEYIEKAASKKDRILSYLPLIYGRKEFL